MSKIVKSMVMSELRKRVGDNRDFVVIDTSKLDAFSVNKLRLELRAQGIFLLGVKNALAKRTFSDMGVSGLDPFLKGPSVIVWGSSDMVALTKELTKRASDNDKLEIKGAALDGTSLDSKQVEALSKSPGRAELIGKVLTLIQSPGAQLAAALLGAGGRVSGQIKSLADKEEAPAA
ncbi:MAG: 50S ribosomal protein L10 [Planctomycetaceae bacterium]|nr:50S ribosomal protein L10 [Planctomycetaceae bacterium]